MTNPWKGKQSQILTAAVVAVLWAFASHADERSLNLHNLNTHENLQVVFKRDGKYVEDGIKALDWFLRDWRREVSVKMDRRLYDVVWEVYQRSGATSPIHVHSGYRSPATNAMLRQRSRAVARHSQHMNGAAMDFHIPGVSSNKLREIALVMEGGGVGFYPKASNPFVHVDVAEVRHWPKMSRGQLAKLFPDGVTVHIPSDGRPLKGFSQALAEIREKTGVLRRGASRAFAAIVPDHIPLPVWRPKREEDQALALASLEPEAIPSQPDHVFFPENAFVPKANPAISAFDQMLSPATTGASVMKVNRRALPDIVTEARRLKPAMVDQGVGAKGPRLGTNAEDEKRAASKPANWKIGGFL